MSLRTFLRALYYIHNFGIKGFRKEEKQLKQKYYQYYDNKFILRPSVVFMIDGRAIHGGLTDRLRGICSVYTYCKQKGIPFHLNAVFPFKLEDYLVPNKYDWRISEEEISYDLRKSTPVLVNDYQFDTRLHRLYLNKRLREKMQIHIYGNTPFLDSHFNESFNELFRPSPRLKADLDNLTATIFPPLSPNLAQQLTSPQATAPLTSTLSTLTPNPSSLTRHYVAIVTRFQQLLGDFKETGYKTLDEEGKQALISKCINKIEELHNTELQGKQILCTSDSVTFLDEVNKLPYVSIIPGKVVHMDHTSDASFETYEKSFLDLFMIAKADEVILLQTGDMYPSGFPKRAAMIGGKPFKQIVF